MDLTIIILVLIIVSLVAYMYFGMKHGGYDPKYIEAVRIVAITHLTPERKQNITEVLNVVENAQFVPMDSVHKKKIYLMKDSKIIGFMWFGMDKEKKEKWYAKMKIGINTDGSPKWDDLHWSDLDKESYDRVCAKIQAVYPHN